MRQKNITSPLQGSFSEVSTHASDKMLRVALRKWQDALIAYFKGNDQVTDSTDLPATRAFMTLPREHQKIVITTLNQNASCQYQEKGGDGIYNPFIDWKNVTTPEFETARTAALQELVNTTAVAIDPEIVDVIQKNCDENPLESWNAVREILNRGLGPVVYDPAQKRSVFKPFTPS